jgi:hypothetical protein
MNHTVERGHALPLSWYNQDGHQQMAAYMLCIMCFCLFTTAGGAQPELSDSPHDSPLKPLVPSVQPACGFQRLQGPQRLTAGAARGRGGRSLPHWAPCRPLMVVQCNLTAVRDWVTEDDALHAEQPPGQRGVM